MDFEDRLKSYQAYQQNFASSLACTSRKQQVAGFVQKEICIGNLTIPSEVTAKNKYEMGAAKVRELLN